MADSVGFYNLGFSIINSKWDIKFVKGYAKTIPSFLVKECSMNEEPIGICQYVNLIVPWTEQEKCIKILENDYKNNE